MADKNKLPSLEGIAGQIQNGAGRRGTLPGANKSTSKQTNKSTFSARGVDEEVAHAIRLAAVADRRNVGDVVTEALQAWLHTREAAP